MQAGWIVGRTQRGFCHGLLDIVEVVAVAIGSITSGDRGFFGRLRSRLNRGKAWLSGDLSGLFAGGIDAETLETLETELLLADVGVEATRSLIDAVERSARSGKDGIEVLRTTVVELLDPLALPLTVPNGAKPFVILTVGVNGTGKTTTVGKLAYRFGAEGRSVVIAAADTFRAAAVEQLAEWGRRAGATVVSQAERADPAAVVHDALTAARARGADIVIADTAGRLHTDASLMDELAKIRRVIARFDPDAPHETLLVLDASQGQNALVQAERFNARLEVSGLAITKLDGTARGGIVIAIARRLALPIRFVAVGEAIEDFAVFSACEFADALIGDGTA